MKGFEEELKELRDRYLQRKPACIESSDNSRIIIDGKPYINFSSNDYLNLAGTPAVVNAGINALKKFGFGSGASRLLSGTYSPHRELEGRIAKFKRTRAALLFNSGYAANTGIIPAIAGEDAVIFSDELNHASIVDGARLSRASVKIFRHRDIDHLESLLKKSFKGNSAGRRVVITDTVFSMDGDMTPLRDLLSVSAGYDALVMIDDAHGTGVLGKTGRGSIEHFGIKPEGIIQMGTLSKAAGCFGAFAAGPKSFISLLINRSRTFMYSTALPPSVAAAGLKAIDIIEFQSDGLRRRLWDNRRIFYEGIERLGYDTLGSETPIVPVLTGGIKDTLRMERHLYKNKIFAPAIRPPTVPEGKCRIRFSVTAAHSRDDIERVLEVVKSF